jgi:type I restriction enzyme S subunit
MVWPTVKLGEICQIEKEQFREGNLPYVGMEDIEGHTGRFLGERSPKSVASSTFKFSDKHVLYGRLRPYLNKVLVPDFEGHCSSEIFPLKPSDKLNRKFLYYWLSSEKIVSAIDATCTGARMPRANVKEVLTFDFGLPSLPEQKRIVAILDQVFSDIDKARALTEKNLKNARELFESYLQQVFSQRGEGWEVRPLESFSTIVNGFAFKSGDFSSKNHVKSIKITNVGVYEFVEEPDNYLPEEFLESHHRYKAYEGDVVVALTRTIISSGLKVAVVPSTYDGALVNQRVAAVQVDESVIPKEMLQAYLSTKMAIDYVRSNVNELMQPNLSIKDLKQFPIPVPPLEKTASVMEEVSELRERTKKLVSIYMSKLNLLDDLKKSLLQKAFSGDLTKDSEEAAA